MNKTINTIYGRASFFGRDLFYYVLSGMTFALVISSPVWPRIRAALESGLPSIYMETGFQIGFFLVAVMMLFGLGHLMLAFGLGIRRLWAWMFRRCKHVRHCNEAVEKISKLGGTKLLVDDKDRNGHVALEMSVFLNQRDLHVGFVERSNTVAYVRLCLGTALICPGVVVLIIGCYWERSQPMLVGAVAVFFGVILMHRHFISRTNFLERVAAAACIGKQGGT